MMEIHTFGRKVLDIGNCDRQCKTTNIHETMADTFLAKQIHMQAKRNGLRNTEQASDVTEAAVRDLFKEYAIDCSSHVITESGHPYHAEMSFLDTPFATGGLQYHHVADEDVQRILQENPRFVCQTRQIIKMVSGYSLVILSDEDGKCYAPTTARILAKASSCCSLHFLPEYAGRLCTSQRWRNWKYSCSSWHRNTCPNSKKFAACFHSKLAIRASRKPRYCKSSTARRMT